jgi:hypothetical protein
MLWLMLLQLLLLLLHLLHMLLLPLDPCLLILLFLCHGYFPLAPPILFSPFLRFLLIDNLLLQ